MASEAGAKVRESFRRLAGAGAEDDAVHAGVESGLDFFGVAHSAAEFAGDFHGGANFFDDGEVAGFAGEGGVEIDEVEPVRAGILPFFGEGDGVGGIDGFFGGEAAAEADDFAAHEVDGGQEVHSVARKLRRRARPAAWLFSGWNWTAWSAPRETLAAKRSPYSHEAETSAGSAGTG